MRTRTVILGAGFGGLELTTLLSEAFGADMDVVLIDKSESFVFGFSKLDVMFGRTVADAVRHRYRDVVKPGVRVVQATAQSVAIAPVDALVNCAGISGPNVKLWDYGVDDWQQVMNININGVFFGCREMVPHMRQRGYGRIVNIASVAGKEGNPNASAYSTSKAAVIGMTKSLGKELADLDIKVNCVTPAAVRTAIFDQMSEQHIQFMLSKIPMGRFGTPDEIAAMVVWLCTEDCSFTTGAVFDLSGGRATY